MKLKMRNDNKAVMVIKDYYLAPHSIRIDYYEKKLYPNFEGHSNRVRIIFNDILGKL
jgi:hypothetical protein